MIDIKVAGSHEQIRHYKAADNSKPEVEREKFGDIFIEAYEKKWAGTYTEKDQVKLKKSMEHYSKSFDDPEQFKGYFGSLGRSVGLL